MAHGYVSGAPIDTSATLGGAGASDQLVPSQKAVKTYVDAATGGSARTGYILPDPSLSLGTTWERRDGLVALLADITYGANVANALTSPPLDHTWTNSAKVVSASVTSTELVFSADTATTYDWATTAATAPVLFAGRTYELGAEQVWFWRIKGTSLPSNTRYAVGMLLDTSDNTKFVQAGIRGAAAGAGNVWYSVGSAQTGTALTAGQVSAGVWIRVVIRNGTIVVVSHSTSTASDPRTITSWTVESTTVTATWGQHRTVRWGAVITSGTTGSTVSANFAAWDDRAAIPPYGTINAGAGAGGYVATSGALTLVASHDLGTSSAVVADADVQAALSAVVNTRYQDTASWTFSVVRDSSASPAAGSYAAAGSVTVSGSGRYLAVYAKHTSTSGLQAGSLRVGDLAIPYTVT